MAKSKKNITTLKHTSDKRTNIPTAEYEAMLKDSDREAIRVAYDRRNRDLDPQLVWRGKDEQDASDLVVHAPPLYIQEKVHPKVLIDDLLKESERRQRAKDEEEAPSLFGDFNGLDDPGKSTEFYSHQQNWTNRMILGDSLQVMASLAEREKLRGQVQCIYIDPPYGIKFNSNFQWSTTSRDVKDGNKDHITREPEQVKAFRDTWRDGIHSYLTYLRDRLTVARDLLKDSGSIFVQIGDENVHRVRALMDEVFGEENFVSEIVLKKGGTTTTAYLPTVTDYIVLYAKNKNSMKYKNLHSIKRVGEGSSTGERYDQLQMKNGYRRSMSRDEKLNPSLLPAESIAFKHSNPCSQHENPNHREKPIIVNGKKYFPPTDRQWSTNLEFMERVIKSDRIIPTGKNLAYIMFITDFPVIPMNNIWTDVLMRSAKSYVVETAISVIERCILMTTDPGDLVLDPTCGSGTTATVCEQWGRRWITIDTSRVALAIARSRVMGARYPYYLLADSKEGLEKEAEVSRTTLKDRPVTEDIRQGFVYERVPHITLKSIANNAEIDVIYDKWQKTLEPLREKLNKELGVKWEEWQIPRELKTKAEAEKDSKSKKSKNKDETEWPEKISSAAPKLHEQWWQARIERQKEIDASIAAKADQEFLYDRPYEDRSKVRVAGPFTVESLSPHRMLLVDEAGEVIDPLKKKMPQSAGTEQDFVQMVLDNLSAAGVQQAEKSGRIEFHSIGAWPGEYVCAEGSYSEGKEDRRAGIFVGPEFGTVSRADLVAAAREAADAGFDALIACGFNFDAHSSEFNKLGKVPVLKARMNPDLHMADELKNTGQGNLFVVFGEPDIEILDAGKDQIQVKVHGIDVFKPQTGEIVSGDADSIALWLIDTDYNEESFFVRHAYFLGANDPYRALKTTLKAEIDEEAWSTLNSDISRPFTKPEGGRIAVKVINHLGDEVMKVFRV